MRSAVPPVQVNATIALELEISATYVTGQITSYIMIIINTMYSEGICYVVYMYVVE